MVNPQLKQAVFEILYRFDLDFLVMREQAPQQIIKQRGQEAKDALQQYGSGGELTGLSEEEKAKLIFALLAERGINLLDHLENCLAEVGFNANVVMSINETMKQVGNLMENIGESQFRQEKLKNERIHLEIQKYKADLKKREIDIKEKVADAGPGNTNIVAVGSASDLLEMMSGGDVNVSETNVVESEDGEESE